MSVSLVQHVSALTTVDWCIKHVVAPTTLDRGVCVSAGTCQYSDHSGWVYQTCQCSKHCGWVFLCLCWNMSVLSPLWTIVSMSQVEYVSALTTADGLSNMLMS